MADNVIIEFFLMKLKPDVPIEQGGDPAWDIWQEMIQVVAKAPGMIKQYFGRQLEEPDIGVHLIVWKTLSDAEDYTTSPAFRPFVDRLETISHKSHLQRLVYPSKGLGLFDSPCTEVFLGYGADKDFADAVTSFAVQVGEEGASVTGFDGFAVGESAVDFARFVATTTTDDTPAVEMEKGPAVALIGGWASREAHFEFKDNSKAMKENIGLLRKGRKDAGMYHVQFKEL